MKKKAAPPADKLVRDAARLSDAYNELVRLTGQESEGKTELVNAFKEVRSWAGQAVPILPQAVTGWPDKIREARVTTDGFLVTTDLTGSERRTPLEELEPSVFFSVVEDYAPKLRQIAKEKRMGIVRQNAPKLSLRATLVGSQILLFDWRRHRLVIANRGGDAENVRLTIGEGRPQAYGPIAVKKGGAVNLDLHRHRDISSPVSLPVTVTCEDQEGLRYEGRGTIELDAKDWQEVSTSLTSPVE